MVNGQCFEQNLNDFLELFSKKVQISYSGRLRAPAVHGVSSKLCVPKFGVRKYELLILSGSCQNLDAIVRKYLDFLQDSR